MCRSSSWRRKRSQQRSALSSRTELTHRLKHAIYFLLFLLLALSPTLLPLPLASSHPIEPLQLLLDLPHDLLPRVPHHHIPLTLHLVQLCQHSNHLILIREQRSVVGPEVKLWCRGGRGGEEREGRGELEGGLKIVEELVEVGKSGEALSTKRGGLVVAG